MSAGVRPPCRLCASSVVDHFDVFTCCSQERPLVQLIKIYLHIDIDLSDGLPSVVCDTCRQKMVSFDEFAITCKQIQTSLKTLHKQTVSKHHENDNDDDEDDNVLSSWRKATENVPLVNVKVENYPDVSVKSEDFSDHFNEEDLLPIAECIKKKSKRKKSKYNNEGKNKRHKKEHSIETKKLNNVRYENDENEIKKEVDECESSVNGEFDEPKKKTRKLKLISGNNSFISFVCHVCSVEFPSWCTLKNHSKDAHDTKARVKCMCDKFLYTRHAVYRHIVKHDISQGFKCGDCNKTYSTRRALKAHSLVHLPKDQYPHVCSHCAKRFPTPFSLKVHEKTHIPKELRYVHPCDICGIKFISKSNVKTHISAVHEKIRPFVCDVCGHAFNNKGNLQDHRVLHSDVKSFPCPKCPKSFKTKGQRQRHIDCHGGTSYKCPECPAILNSRRTLRMHMCVHEDTVRYICAFCNKGYKRRKSLKSHMNIHTGERPYSCQWCSRTFADNSNCRIHKRRMHPNELAEYEALHGKPLEVKDNYPEEKKVIYNIAFKKKTENSIIVMPDIAEFINETPP